MPRRAPSPAIDVPSSSFHRPRFVFSAMGLVLAALACAAPTTGVTSVPPTVSTPTLVPTSTSTPIQTATPEQCNSFYTESDNPLPSEPVQSFLTSAGLTVNSVSIWGHGETSASNCPSIPATFHAQYVDLTLELPAPDLKDLEALGTLTAQVMATFQGLPYAAAPNWQQGATHLIFVQGPQKLGVFIANPDLALLESAQGAALWQALNHRDCQIVSTPLPVTDLNGPLQASLQNADLPQVGVTAITSLTDCLDLQAALTRRATQTDFTVDISVSDLTDTADLGDLAAPALNLIAALPVDQIIDSDQSQIHLTFHARGNTASKSYSIYYATAVQANQQRLKGADLITFLQNNP